MMVRPSERRAIVKPVGKRLFVHDLRLWLEGRFHHQAERVARDFFAKPGPVARMAFRAAAKEAVGIEALEILEVAGVGGEPCSIGMFNTQIGLRVTFSGDPQLWLCVTRRMRESRPIHGVLLGNVLTLGAAYDAGNEIVAQGALASDLDLVLEHLRAQAAVIKDYVAHLSGNVLTYVSKNWDFHEARRPVYRKDAMMRAHCRQLLAVAEGHESAPPYEASWDIAAD